MLGLRFSFVFLLGFFSLAFAEPQIRVLIDELRGAGTLQMSGGYHAYLASGFWYSQPVSDSRTVQALADTIYFDGQALGQSLRLEPMEPYFYWQGLYYRGSLAFVAEADRLLVLNILDIEDYLKGVVAVEMKADWELEALKAQAVAARTYVLAHLDPTALYDICATEGCQRYDGYSAEHPRSNQAVEETSGVVVMYQGNFAKTFYHADSGGLIASSQEVWGAELAYLPAHEDFAHASPHRSWSVSLDAAQMTASLNAIGRGVGTVSALRVSSISTTGRVTEVSVQGTAGSTKLSGKSLRELLRAWGLRSTKFAMTGSLSAQGSGYGHGVGMSQYGANALAKTGYEFTQILGFYYPYTELHRLTYALASVEP